MVTFDLTDGYTTNDIIYEWSPAGVVVGNNEMAQFEYKSNNISSSIENFSVGKYVEHHECVLIYRAFLLLSIIKPKLPLYWLTTKVRDNQVNQSKSHQMHVADRKSEKLTSVNKSRMVFGLHASFFFE